jgi:hypothetical protein
MKLKSLLAPKRVATFVFLASVVAAAPGITRLKVEADATNAFVPKHGHEAEVYKHFLDTFTPDFGTVVIATGDVWQPERWKAFCDLSAELEGLDVVERVIGLPNADYVTGTAEQVEVRDFTELAPEAGEPLRDLAVGYEPYRRILVTEDGRAVALYVASKRDIDAITFDDAIRAAMKKYTAAFRTEAGGELFQSGDMYVNAEVSRQTEKSTLILAISMLVMLVVATISTRRIVGGILCVASGVFAAYFTFALMGYLGIAQNPFNSLTLNIMIPLGTAYTIHAMEYTQRETRYILGIIPVAGVVPFLFAAGTTVLGFGTTAIIDNVNIQQFGLLGAFGILMVLYTTLFLTFPLTVRTGHTPPPVESLQIPRLLAWPARLSRGATVALVAIMFGLTGIGMAFVKVNYEAIDYLLPSNPARMDADRGTRLFSRQLMPLVVYGGGPDSALDPKLWTKIDALLARLRKDYPEVKTSWIYDQIKQLSLAYTADDPTPTAMPGSSDLIAQYLLLFREHDLQPYLDAERKDLSVVLHTPARNSMEFHAFEKDLRGRIEAAGLHAELTGRQAAFFHMGDRIAWNNVRSTVFSAIVLWITFTLMVGSFTVGTIALVVNTLPVFACLGFLGLSGIELDLGSSMVMAIALGLVVDDTGHLIIRYRTNRLAGCAPREAIDLTMRAHWSPVIIATLVIVAGFSVLNFAPLVPFHSFSRTLSATLAFAVLGDLILMPPLLIHFDRSGWKENAS